MADDSDEEYMSGVVDTPSSRPSSEIPDDSHANPGVSSRTRSNINERTANGYSWEDEYQRSWDIVKDDKDTSFQTMVQSIIENRKKKIMKHYSSIPLQRGIIRTLVLIIDDSVAMNDKDLRPNRFILTLNYIQEFIVEFFDQNPISQMGIVLMRNGLAYLITEVNGSPQYHIDKIRQLKSRQHNKFEPKGDPSLQNSLEMARSLLKYNSNNNEKTSQEILIIFGALFTSDPGDIHKTIDSLVRDNIKVKVIGLSAQVSICRQLVNKTNNSTNPKNYGVIMNEAHFKELLMDCVPPLPLTEEEINPQHVPLIKMGFPKKIQTTSTSSTDYTIEFPQLNASYPQAGSETIPMTQTPTVTYQCPQCKSKVVNLPTICPVCGLMLILSTHLARSYHHLLPLVPYKEVAISEVYESEFCFGCQLKFPGGGGKQLSSSRYKCEKCGMDFCINCDVFVHEVLHNCPGCENK
ncbi:Suppressor of stem-loop protein 1 [Spathaspora sp. JA1]|nr:Suppressor of stem-loop protein 1 [Spathaspora sp. JA1]